MQFNCFGVLVQARVWGAVWGAALFEVLAAAQAHFLQDSRAASDIDKPRCIESAPMLHLHTPSRGAPPRTMYCPILEQPCQWVGLSLLLRVLPFMVL